VPPEPFGTYVEAVQTGNLLFLSGMLPTEGGGAKFIGRIGAELDVGAGCQAARLAALNVLAVTRQHLGSLNKVTRIVRLGVSVATSGDVREQAKVADAASELLQDVFGKDKSPCRSVYGVASLPLGTPVELEIIFEVAGRMGLRDLPHGVGGFCDARIVSTAGPSPKKGIYLEHSTLYRTAQTDGLSIFYREADPKHAPSLWTVGREGQIPEKSDVRIVGEYHPTSFLLSY